MRTLLAGFAGALTLALTGPASAAGGCTQMGTNQRCEATDPAAQIAPGAVHTVTATCPGPTHAYGGGVTLVPAPDRLEEVRNGRLAGDRGWTVSLLNRSSAPVTSEVTAFAFCR